MQYKCSNCGADTTRELDKNIVFAHEYTFSKKFWPKKSMQFCKPCSKIIRALQKKMKLKNKPKDFQLVLMAWENPLMLLCM